MTARTKPQTIDCPWWDKRFRLSGVVVNPFFTNLLEPFGVSAKPF